MICEKCGKEFFEDWRKDKEARKNKPRFCCRACANSRAFSDETNRKKSEAAKKWAIENPEKCKERNNNFEGTRRWKEIRLKHLIEGDFEVFSFDLKRKRIILEQENKCAHCNIDKWNGKKIILEIDHIDGDRKNNSRDNLEAICPNCHSLTPTWRGRNIGITQRVSDEQIISSFLESGNIRQCLIKLGLAPKGANYKRVKSLILDLDF